MFFIDRLDILVRENYVDNILSCDCLKNIEHNESNTKATLGNLQISTNEFYTKISGSPSRFLEKKVVFNNLDEYLEIITNILNIPIVEKGENRRIDMAFDFDGKIDMLQNSFLSMPNYNKSISSGYLYFNSSKEHSKSSQILFFYQKYDNTIRYENRLFSRQKNRNGSINMIGYTKDLFKKDYYNKLIHVAYNSFMKIKKVTSTPCIETRNAKDIEVTLTNLLFNQGGLAAINQYKSTLVGKRKHELYRRVANHLQPLEKDLEFTQIIKEGYLKSLVK